MADIKTMTQELTDMSADIEESMLSGEYTEVVAILKKMIEKLDELVEAQNAE
mgnify:CR=1 FL=1|tara:strand:- start:230 stop:385 length:156 start_codon:yes stop_codon:yes gene_type:complete